MLVATHLALTYLGKGGIYSLAALMGVTDVDPFIMGMTQEAGISTSLQVAAWASSSPPPATTWSRAATPTPWPGARPGCWSLVMLAGLGAAGLVPVLWM